jgi:hypothetical protein
MKKQIEYILLTFAITTIIWNIGFSIIIGKVEKKYKQKIEILEQKCK